MAKIMLVEDDNNLREIYEARLLAEGYEIVSAKDGEEALAMAVKEKPDLIISDVMMPKISGFDMLDILRSTPETKNTKVIMMTALSQVEDKTRADKLGADRYLVKSQVTLEDVAKVARDVLSGEDGSSNTSYTDSLAATPGSVPEPVAAEPPQPSNATPVTEPTPIVTAPQPAPDTAAPLASEPAMAAPAPAPEPVAAEPPQPVMTAPVADPVPAAKPVNAVTTAAEPDAQSVAEEASSVQSQIDSYVEQLPTEPIAAVEPVQSAEDPGIKAAQLAEAVNNIMEGQDTQAVAPETPAPTAADTTPAAPVSATSAGDAPSQLRKVITPINNPTVKPDLDELLQKEQAKEASQAPVQNPPAVTPQTPPDDKVDPHSIAL